MPYSKPPGSMKVTWDTTYDIVVRVEHYAPWLFEWNIGYWAYVQNTARGGLIAEAWRPTRRWAVRVAFSQAMAKLGLPHIITCDPIPAKPLVGTK